MTKTEKLCRWIQEANTLVVLTGAGISVPSGIPDFRSSPDGMAETVLTYGYMMAHPEEFTCYCMNKLYHKDAKPNEAHVFLRNLERAGRINSIITQNIDDLHQKCGSERVFPLHGSIHSWYCMECEKTYSPDALDRKHANYCACGGFIRPAVTLYGEPLDETYYHLALTASQIADTFLVIGSSLSVNPAASLLQYYAGKRLIIINKTATPYDKYAGLVIHKDICEVLREIREREKKS